MPMPCKKEGLVGLSLKNLKTTSLCHYYQSYKYKLDGMVAFDSSHGSSTNQMTASLPSCYGNNNEDVDMAKCDNNKIMKTKTTTML